MNKPIVYVDAGHYGKYNRSPVVPEFTEAEVMWRFHLLQIQALQERGFDARCVRQEESEDMPLFQRGYAAKGGALFLSNHANYADRESADFVQVYHLTEDTGTDVDDISRAIAQKLAPVVASVMGTKEPYQVLSRLAKTDKNSDGMINDNSLGVLNGARQANVPGLLIEHSFYSNAVMAAWLMEEENLKKLAQAEADVLAEHFGLVKEEVKMLDMQLPVLKKGMKTDPVRSLQALLIGYGYDVGNKGIDGSFGGATDRALKAYQTANGLVSDGSCGRKTWSKLLELN